MILRYGQLEGYNYYVYNKSLLAFLYFSSYLDYTTEMWEDTVKPIIDEVPKHYMELDDLSKVSEAI